MLKAGAWDSSPRVPCCLWRCDRAECALSLASRSVRIRVHACKSGLRRVALCEQAVRVHTGVSCGDGCLTSSLMQVILPHVSLCLHVFEGARTLHVEHAHATCNTYSCSLYAHAHAHPHIHMNHDGKAEQICLCVTNLSTVCLTDQQGSQSHTHSLAHCTHDRAHRRSYASSEMTITGVQLEHLSCIFLCPYSCFINIIRIDALTALVRSVKDTRKCGEPRLGTVSDSDTPTDATRGAAASTRTGRFWECFRDNPIS